MGRCQWQWMPFWPPLLPADKPKSIKHKNDTNILLSTLIYWIELNPLTAALKNECARPPATPTVWIHQIHAAGGASGSITMVVVFVGCLCCCGWTRDVTSSSYVKKWYKNDLKMRLTVLLFDPPRRAPYLSLNSHVCRFSLNADSITTLISHRNVPT